MPRGAVTRRALVASALAALAGCTAGARVPGPILVGADTCAFCRMTILDERLAAQYLLEGRAIAFDEAGCLRDWVLAHDPARRGEAWLRDVAEGGWVRAGAAVLVAGAARTPMSTNVVAFRDAAAAGRYVRERGGRLLDPGELLGNAARAGTRYPLAQGLPVRADGHAGGGP